MLEFIINHMKELINSIGIFFDIIGAWLVAWEVVREYRGEKYDSSTPGHFIGTMVVGSRPNENKKFREWEINKYIKMRFGLAFLTLGFTLQLVSNWIN